MNGRYQVFNKIFLILDESKYILNKDIFIMNESISGHWLIYTYLDKILTKIYACINQRTLSYTQHPHIYKLVDHSWRRPEVLIFINFYTKV